MRRDGKVALGLLCGLVEQIAALRAQGIEVLVVSSGAIGLGVERLGLAERPTALVADPGVRGDWAVAADGAV